MSPCLLLFLLPINRLLGWFVITFLMLSALCFIIRKPSEEFSYWHWITHRKIFTSISMAAVSIALYDWPESWPYFLLFLLRLITDQTNLNGGKHYSHHIHVFRDLMSIFLVNLYWLFAKQVLQTFGSVSNCCLK